MQIAIKVSILIFIIQSILILAQNDEESTDALFGEDVPLGYFARKNLSDCPTRFHNRFQRDQCLIHGGELANSTEFPHMAVIGWINGRDVAWKCGGSLITTKFVLTAAHCAVDETNEGPALVRLGDVNLASDKDDSFAQQFNILHFIRHPQHRFITKYHDIALIELDRKIDVTVGVCPVCVWSQPDIPYDVFDIAGFGATGYAVKGSPQLLKAFLMTEDIKKCSADFGTTRGLPNGIVEEQLCASNLAMDTCQGDSGGPLQITLYTYDRIIPILIGITSFGKGCGFGSFGVYQKVQPYITWIESIVGESLNTLECANRYEKYRNAYRLEADCQVVNPYVSRVEIHWKPNEQVRPCAGALIDYNTVLTSASCTTNANGEEPSYISILGQNVTITEITRHPHNTPGSIKNNIALIRLEKYLLKNNKAAPVCLDTSTFDSGISSIQIVQNSTSGKSHLFIPSQEECSDRNLLRFNFTQDLDQSHSCFNTENHLIPGLCEIDRGGPFLNRYHTTLFGINVHEDACGPYNPLIVLKLGNYISWIESFVLDRSVTPEPPIVFKDDDNLSLFFKPCKTKGDVTGVCLDHWSCGLEIEKQRANQTSLTLCGFEEDIAYICCPQSSIGKKANVIRPLPLIPIIKNLNEESSRM